ncbi:uncharacterized protein LOC107635806 [Arachis ipaensis]|uniref:uncharacterized protein LOC107635806 n=1 Tax=Arachis ipaensis TaxID=130454 RepID=UPI0007AF48D2|nr:uncharacterized protein LOC107635806 [Arachis ipaensis]
MNPSEMLSVQSVPTRGGPWKDICSLQISEPQVREKMITGLSMELENGRTIRFWEDRWLPSGALKDEFPRLFSVSNLTGSVIGDCGFWDGMEWVWTFQWRRELLQWELELVNQLHERIRCCKRKLFRRKSRAIASLALFGEGSSHQGLSYLLGLCWLAGRRLRTACVWCAWLFVLGRVWTVPGSLKQHFESWTNASGRKMDRKRWFIGFFAVIWAIWQERNARIFKDQASDVVDIISRSFSLSDEWIGDAPCSC